MTVWKEGEDPHFEEPSFALGQAYDSGYKSGFKWASKEAGQDVKDIVNLPNLTDREKLARILFIADELANL